MIRLLALLAVLLICEAKAQSTNSTPAPGAATNAPVSQPARPSLQSEIVSAAPVDGLVLKPERPNEIVKGKLTYSGISVEVAKTHRPLQLFNPLAPPQYGSAEDNVVRDPINGRATGLKLFAIRF